MAKPSKDLSRKVNVFVSWSGRRSSEIALALRDWLPPVIMQRVHPWMSETDIGLGTGSMESLHRSLSTTHVGIFCLTPENRDVPWIHYEAGAIGRGKMAGVVPYLFEMEKADLTGPLREFQACRADKQGTRMLLRAVNNAIDEVQGEPLTPSELDENFEMKWLSLERKLNAVPRIRGIQDPPDLARAFAIEGQKEGRPDVPPDYYFLRHSSFLRDDLQDDLRQKTNYPGDVYHFKVVVDSYYDSALAKIDRVIWHLPEPWDQSPIVSTDREDKFGMMNLTWGDPVVWADIHLKGYRDPVRLQAFVPRTRYGPPLGRHRIRRDD